MSRALKLIGLLFLPVAVIIFIFTLLGGKTGRNGNSMFLHEYDEQNIYG